MANGTPDQARPTLGIDVGGSGIKGAPVDLQTGEFVAERLRIATPTVSTPAAIAAIVAAIAEHFHALCADGPIGITIPGVVTGGVIRTAANIDNRWVGCDAGQLFTERLGRPVSLLNDADAAGVAEVRYGAAKGHDGLVIMTTLGTGIGVALVHDGVLIPNSELGRLVLDGHVAETRASTAARKREDLSWELWAERLSRYYNTIEDLLWPELFVVGGGISRKSKRFLPLLNIRTPIVPASLLNRAGIVGAALLANRAAEKR